MSAPITHIVLTSKVFDKYFKEMDRQEFFLGTILPDIRYLEDMERERTHFDNVKMKDLQNIDSFTAGLKFHSLVDDLRKKYVENHNYYSLFPKSEYITFASKSLEDRILYNKINNWNEILSYLNKISKGEVNLGIKEETIKKWHKLLQNYFSYKPDDKSEIAFTTGIGHSIELAKDIINTIDNTQIKKVEKIELEFYDNFEKLLEV